MSIPAPNSDVLTVLEDYPAPLRRCLMEVRAMIFKAAERTDGVGPLEECLRWGQPSYLTAQTKSGSMIRLGLVKNNAAAIGLFVHCQTSLVSQFRELYSDDLNFEGNRAVVIDSAAPPPPEVLQHCIQLALTYHLNKTKVAS